MGLQDVRVRPASPARLEAIIGPERTATFEATAEAVRGLLADRMVLNVNSTAVGGGVAELLQTLLATACGIGVDARWAVIEGDPAFFTITKRIHNHLYGMAGDGGPLGPAEHEQYEAALADNATQLLDLVRPGDVVLLHDPQTAGLARSLMQAGANVVWRCHVGLDTQNDRSRLAWDFLRRYVEDVHSFVFSREEFAPDWISRQMLSTVPPSIDPFSAKNESMGPPDVRRVLQHVGLLAGEPDAPPPTFTRRDGPPGSITHRVELFDTGPPPAPEVPLVLQASRWDALKDMGGVMTAFADHLDDMGDAHLVLAGPGAGTVADDPEAAAVLDECLTVWRRLAVAARARIHLACLPMTDGEENAAILNALQRHASVVVQKSLAEGFGLTVAEAMWKGRPVIGSAVGGIVDQIIDGETGLLLTDPFDLSTFAEQMSRLIADPGEAERMGANGQRRVTEHFLADRHLQQWAQIIASQLA
ncbi:MAG: glycosyltransferase [Actinomycetota bacterium]|nr:glycosyltransferase [Actinomycetota bacterium]